MFDFHGAPVTTVGLADGELIHVYMDAFSIVRLVVFIGPTLHFCLVGCAVGNFLSVYLMQLPDV